MKLLIIEDEERTAKSLKKGFSEEGFDIELAFDGETGQKLARTKEFDCIILDLMIPKINGISVLRTIRSKNIFTPVLILTAKNSIEDKVEGLEIGADDYLAKPFSFEELLARVRALIRRSTRRNSVVLKAGNLELNPKDLTVLRNGKYISLSKIEFKILEYMLTHKGSILSESRIIQYVWTNSSDISSNVVAAHIKNIRNKIDKVFPKEKPLIKTVRGLGYKVDDE